MHEVSLIRYGNGSRRGTRWETVQCDDLGIVETIQSPGGPVLVYAMEFTFQSGDKHKVLTSTRNWADPIPDRQWNERAFLACYGFDLNSFEQFCENERWLEYFKDRVKLSVCNGSTYEAA